MRYPYIVTSHGDRISMEELMIELAIRRQAGQCIVTTNGCFDLLHPGHISLLKEARSLGDVLVVGLNSDESVTRLKGQGKPILSEIDRAEQLAALRYVDYVLVFSDALPNAWLMQLRADIHCKAGDYTEADMPEANVIRAFGGDIRILPFREGFSSSKIIGRMVASPQEASSTTPSDQTIAQEMIDISNVLRLTAYRLADTIERVGAVIVNALGRGGAISVCGDTSEIAIAGHCAGVLAFPCCQRLTDFGKRDGDVLLVFSADGQSTETLTAATTARQAGMTVIAFTGDVESPLQQVAQEVFNVPTRQFGQIHQAHLAIISQLALMINRAGVAPRVEELPA